MARGVTTDYFQNMRFHVSVTNAQGIDLKTGKPTHAGFTSVSAPKASMPAVMYKEGQMIYDRKQPGAPTIADVTMARGIARMDTSFWDWARVIIEGSGEYRADLVVNHYHRENSLPRSFPASGINNASQLDLDAAARSYHLWNCFPTDVEPSSNWESGSNEVSIMNMTVAVESFEVVDNTDTKFPYPPHS